MTSWPRRMTELMVAASPCRAGGRGGVLVVHGRDVGEVEEALPFAAEVHECGLQALLHGGDARTVDGEATIGDAPRRSI